MARSRQVLRKIKPLDQRAFDDRLWPINLSLVVFVSFVSGVLLVRMEPENFEDPWWRWGLILGLFVISVVVMGALHFLDSRYLRRGLQLALVLSLTIHAGLALVMVTWPFQTSMTKSPKPSVEESTKERQETVQDFIVAIVSQSNQSKPDFLRPVETATPEISPQKMTRRIDRLPENNPSLRPVPINDDQISPSPSTVRTKRNIEAIPHRAEFESVFSRRSENSPTVVAEPVPVIEMVQRSVRSKELVAKLSMTTRDEREVTVARQTIEIEFDEPSEVQSTDVTRQRWNTVPDKGKIEMSRQNRNPQVNQPIRGVENVNVDQLLTSRVDSPSELEPRRTEQQRRRDTARLTEPVMLLPESVTGPADAVPIDALAVRPTEPSRGVSSPEIRTASRLTQRFPRDPQIEGTEVNASMSLSSTTVAAAPVSVTESPQQLQMRHAPSVERETRVDVGKLVLSRGSGGRAGNGSSENIGQSTAALTGVAPVASAAARRAKSTQTTPQGPALTPSQTSEVPSLRSGAERMTSTVFIDTVEIAVMHRSQQIESIEATSSAMSRQAASDVEIETRTVVVGTENVDLGSSQVVPEEGTGRSAGGGQSELSLVHPLKRQEYSQPSVAVDGDSSRSETRIESVMRSRETLEILAVSRTVEHLPQGEASSREMIRMVPANAGSVVRSNPTTVETDGAGPATVETRSVADGGIEPAVFIPHSTERISLMSEEAPGATGVHSPATFLERSKAGPPMLTAVKLPEGALAVTPLRQPMMSLPASDTQDVQRNLDEPVVVDVKIDVPDVKGPGGIRAEPNRKVGSMIRRASRDSELLAMTDVRFLVPDRTGAPSISGTEKVAAPAFSERLSRKQGSQNGANLTSMEVQIDEAIERGLGFLARHQASNGSWSLHQFAVGKPYQDAISDEAIDADTAATGLALLSFMGAGYHHREDMYQEVVRAAIEYLKRNQRSDGNLFVSEGPNANRSAALYSHAIASIALCEAYGMTLDSELKNSAQMALKYITQSQHLIRGGWRYQPNAGTDTSVSGWMMMALKSGQLANLEVPEETFAKIVDYLDLASTGQQPYLFAYNPYAPDTPQQRHGRRPSKTMTAVGLLMRLYSGWGRDYSDMVRGADYLLKHPPSFQDRDTYFWYYATQVMFHMGGEYWKKWNQQLYSLLRASQTIEGPLAGSWDPHNPVSDKWGKHAGRLYVTTMNLLSLEIRYRHLPIYEEVTGE